LLYKSYHKYFLQFVPVRLVLTVHPVGHGCDRDVLQSHAGEGCPGRQVLGEEDWYRVRTERCLQWRFKSGKFVRHCCSKECWINQFDWNHQPAGFCCWNFCPRQSDPVTAKNRLNKLTLVWNQKF